MMFSAAAIWSCSVWESGLAAGVITPLHLRIPAFVRLNGDIRHGIYFPRYLQARSVKDGGASPRGGTQNSGRQERLPGRWETRDEA